MPTLVHGQTFEEMVVGSRFRTASRTITETDLVTFVTLTGMNEPLFLDEAGSRDAGYAGRLVPGALVFSYAEGLVMQTGVIHGTGMAFLRADVSVQAPVSSGTRSPWSWRLPSHGRRVLGRAASLPRGTPW